MGKPPAALWLAGTPRIDPASLRLHASDRLSDVGAFETHHETASAKTGIAAMSSDDASIGTETAFSWKVYSVSTRDKEPLLRFIHDALKARVAWCEA